MKTRKEFNDCIKDNKLIEVGVKDESMAEELVKLAEHRLSFWNSVKEKSKEFPSLFLEGHYEVIKELGTAILALEGWKALDHECLFAFLKDKKQELEIDFNYLLELKDTRNSIDYRGIMVNNEIWKNNEMKILLIIKTLKDNIKNKLKS